MKMIIMKATKITLSIFLTLIMVSCVSSLMMPVALALPDTISLLNTTTPNTENDNEDDHVIEDDPTPLGSGLNATNGSWSVWLLIPIVLTASLAGLIGVRILVSKKRNEEDS